MENKNAHYFKYALGEIVLVVIGILIALQINNWNEQRKKNKVKKSYKTSLISDLTKDSIQLDARLKFNYTQKTFNQNVIGLINDRTTTARDIFDFMLKNEVPLGLRVKNTYNSNTFDLMISTGNIDLFTNDFINDLMQLNKLQKEELQVSNSNSSIYFDTYNNFRTKFTGSYQIDNTELIRNLWKENDVNNSAVMYINLISQQGHTISRYIELSEKVKLKTEELLNKLQSDENL